MYISSKNFGKNFYLSVCNSRISCTFARIFVKRFIKQSMKSKIFLSILALLIMGFIYSCVPGNYDPDGTTPNDYEVNLDVTKKIDANKTGELKVWIGLDKYEFFVEEEMVRDSTTIIANIRQYIKITPIAPEFDISPKETGCIKIDTTGVSETFILTPKKGTYGKVKVSAKIELYECVDCSGTPIPKTTKTLTVSVVVSITSLLGQLFDEFWKQFLIFFGSFVALLFSIILYRMRKKAGITEKDDN